MTAVNQITLKDYAYEATANTPINAGEVAPLGPLSVVVTPLDSRDGNPQSAPVAVPASGGTVYYRGTGTNSTDAAVETQVWSSVELPSGTVITQNTPRDVRIKANGTRRFPRAINVASGSPSGTYTVTIYVGTYPDGAVSQDSFNIEKASTRSGTPSWTDEQMVAMGFEALFGSGVATVDASTDDVESSTASVLGAAYPNPFNPMATVPFTLAQDGEVRLAVYDLLGREVAVLAQGRMSAGSHTAVFDASRLSSGTYLVRFSAPDGSIQTQRLTLMK